MSLSSGPTRLIAIVVLSNEAEAPLDDTLADNDVKVEESKASHDVTNPLFEVRIFPKSGIKNSRKIIVIRKKLSQGDSSCII